MSDTTLRFAFALGCVAGCWAQEREPGSDGSTEGDAPTVVTLIATDNDFRTPHTLEAG